MCGDANGTDPWAAAAVPSVEPSSTTMISLSTSSSPIRRMTSPMVAASLNAGTMNETFKRADRICDAVGQGQRSRAKTTGTASASAANA